MYVALSKRILDFSLALLALVFLSWLFLLIIFVYVFHGYFQLIFSQQRIGFQNKSFTIYKFKTLKAEETQDIQSRRFWWGDVLRFLSLDELPQLINVLKGDMSFVGPRPLPQEYLPLYSSQQRRRHSVRPGITGWAQVNGRNSISWKRKFEYDLYYVDHISFKFDMKIIWKTILLIFSARPDVSLHESKFTGEM